MRILALVLLSIAAGVSAAEPQPKSQRHAPSPQQQQQQQQQPAPATAQAQPQQQQAQAPAIELKNKSSFKMDNGSRSPFWPIGWKPTAKIAHTDTTDQAGADIPPTAFAVTSITLGAGGHFAIINGKIMGEGQQFGLQIGSQTYQITVKAIEDGQVILSRRDQEIAVPLRRK
jgi:hypothetical protein